MHTCKSYYNRKLDILVQLAEHCLYAAGRVKYALAFVLTGMHLNVAELQAPGSASRMVTDHAHTQLQIIYYSRSHT